MSIKQAATTSHETRDNSAHDIKKEALERDLRLRDQEKDLIYQLEQIQKFLRLERI
ncbi:MAG: hypothetical protein WBB26_00060 [Saprospiraceae bacterium]